MNPWSFIAAGWLNPIFDKGNKAPLTASDLNTFGKSHQSRHLVNSLDGFWNDQSESYLKTFVWEFSRRALLLEGLLRVLYIALVVVVSPNLIGLIISFLENQTSSWEAGFGWASAIFGVQLVALAVKQLSESIISDYVVRLAGTISILAFKKAARLSPDSSKVDSEGEVLTIGLFRRGSTNDHEQ